MSAEEFIKKWRSAINYLGLSSVGIHCDWDKISLESRTASYYSEDAWSRIYGFVTPWFKAPKTFKEIIDSNDSWHNSSIQKNKSFSILY